MPSADPPTRDLERLVRRLRGLSPAAWSAAGRSQRVRRLAADLAALDPSPHDLPELPDHALPDVIAVLGADAVAARPAQAAELLAAAAREVG